MKATKACRKRGHETEELARLVIASIKRERGGNATLEAYKCNRCPYWHVGHRRSTKRKRKVYRDS